MVAKAKGKNSKSTDKYKNAILIRGLRGDIKKKFHLKCIEEGTTMTERIKELIEADVENGEEE